MLKTARTTFVALIASVAMLAASASLAHAQTGGSTTPTSAPAAPTSGGTSWTVYKKATWYGPGFWGRRTGCGGRLGYSQLGVAHKTLPCGTKVTLRHRGRSLRVPVIDRGPYVGGREYDLTAATAARLGFKGHGGILTTH